MLGKSLYINKWTWHLPWSRCLKTFVRLNVLSMVLCHIFASKANFVCPFPFTTGGSWKKSPVMMI